MSSTRLLRQALAESTMLAGIGALAGLVLAHGVLQAMLAYAPIDLPRHAAPGDPSTMALSGAALVAVALLASYVPIRRMLAQNPLASLRND